MSFFTNAPQSVDRRRAVRRPGHLGAFIVLANGGNIRCLVKNHSTIGALLAVQSGQGVPTEFDLQVAASPLRSVQVVRRDAGIIAVRFI